MYNNDNALNVAMKSANDFIELYRKYYSHGMLSEQANEMENVIKIPTSMLKITKGRFKYKDNISYDPRYIFISIPIETVDKGFRLNNPLFGRVTNEMSIEEFNKKTNKSIDLFADGKKIRPLDIRIRLYDYMIVLKISYSKYEDTINFNIILRDYYNDIYISNYYDEIPINASIFNRSNTNVIDSCVIYGDGKLIKHFSIEQHPTTKLKIYDFKPKEVEIIYYPGVLYTGILNKSGNIFDIGYNVGTKLTITPENILLFSDKGLYANPTITQLTRSCFNASYIPSNTIYGVLLYNPSLVEQDNVYFDNFNTFCKKYKKKDPLAVVSARPQMPNFIKNFKLNTDIRITYNDYMSNGTVYSWKTYPYNISKIADICNYNEQYLHLLYGCINVNMENFKKFKDERVQFIGSAYAKSERFDSSQDISDQKYYVKFTDKMILYKLGKDTGRMFNVYANGIRMYEDYKVIKDPINGVLLYVRKSTLLKYHSSTLPYIEVEYFGTSYNQARSIFINIPAGAPSMTMRLTDLVEKGLLDESFMDIKYLKLFEDKHTLSPLKFNVDIANNKLTIYSNGGNSCTLVNTNYLQKIELSTKSRISNNPEVYIPMEYYMPDINYFRVFKNGKEVPRKFLKLNLKNMYDSISIQGNFALRESIIIEYCPNAFEDLYKEKDIITNNDAFISQANLATKLINSDIDTVYTTANGTRTSFTNMTETNDAAYVNCYNHIPNKYLGLHIYKGFMYDVMCEIAKSNTIKLNKCEFSKYVETQIKPGPVYDEISMMESYYTRMYNLYYDLYNEYLKYNAVDMAKKLPEYIQIKYHELIDENYGNTILIDCEEKFKDFMPLDANVVPDKNNVVCIDGIYLAKLDNPRVMIEIDYNELPAGMYEKYKVIFDANTMIVNKPIND